MAGFENDVLLAKNMNFDLAAAKPHLGVINAAGKLPIGTGNSSPTPEILGGSLVSPDGSITIGYSSPNITLVAGGSMATIYQADVGSATPAGGILNVLHLGESRTNGSGNTLTIFAPRTAKFVVDPTLNNGTNQTIQSAIDAATSGNTIFIRPGTYTENLTLKAGVNLAAYDCDALTPNVTIVGKCTFTAAGTVSISGIRLQTNSDFCLAVTGSAASIVNIKNCYINCSNNTGISFTSSSASAAILIENTNGNLGTTGIGLFSSSSAGTLTIRWGGFTNTGGSSTASSVSAGSIFLSFSSFAFPLSTSSTGIISFTYVNLNTSAQNATGLTTAGTGTSFMDYTDIISGTASAVSVGAGTTVQVLNCGRIDSTNTNAITGAGTINYGLLTFTNTSNTINTTTQTDYITRYGTLQSAIQPAFSAQHTVAQNNVTGNGALATVNYTTEIFDQGADYDGTNTFTAPYTGRYQFNASIFINDAGTSNQGFPFIITSNRNYNGVVTTPFPLVTLNQYSLIMSVLADMDAADTCLIKVQVSGMAGDTADIPTTDGQFFSGYLVC